MRSHLKHCVRYFLSFPDLLITLLPSIVGIRLVPIPVMLRPIAAIPTLPCIHINASGSVQLILILD
jgi:hypothetical protein